MNICFACQESCASRPVSCRSLGYRGRNKLAYQIVAPRLSEAERSELRSAVAATREALAEFMDRRRQGAMRGESLQIIGVAAAGIVADALDDSGVLWEAKTDNWKTYAEFLKG